MLNKSSLPAGKPAQSLVQRVTKTFLTWMAAAYVLSLAGLWWSAHYVVEANLKKELLSITQELDEMGTPLFFSDQSPAMERVQNFAKKNPDILAVRYYRAADIKVLGQYLKQGDTLVAEMPSKMLGFVQQPEFTRSEILSEHKFGMITSMRSLTPIRTRSMKDEQILDMSNLNNHQGEQSKTIGYLDVAIDIAPSRTMIFKAVALAAILSSLFLLAALLLGRRQVKKALNSLLQLQQPLKQLAEGNFDVVVQHNARDLEIATVCDAVNKTISALRQRNAEIEDAIRAKLEAQAASEAKNLFLAHMSHEIRTPLNGITGFLKLLAKTPLNNTQQEYLQTTEVSAKTLLTVINDILDFSKIEAGKISVEHLEIELRELLEEALSLHAANAEDKQLELVFIYNKSVPTRLLGDPARISQVLSNLVGNAIKFTQEGEILVTADLEEETSNDVLIKVSVKDTGIGIPSEALSRLFQPFSQADASTTRKYGGTGLGLIISKRLVELMGGNITVDSQVGKGTRFTFTLRLMKQPTAVVSMPMADIMAAQRILIVTPSVMVARSLEENLSSWGIESDTAGSGEAALCMLELAGRKRRQYGAIILDQSIKDILPQAFAEGIQASVNGGAMPLLLLGGLSNGPSSEQAKQYGFTGVVSKPAKSSELFNELTKIFIGSKKIAANRHMPMDEAELRLVQNGRKLKVLIVDDNEINRKLAKILIDQLGGQAELAEDGAQAVEACRHCRYDLVLMDIHMPIMDGLEATARIREMERNRHHTLIIALTANAMSGDRERYLASGMDDYLGKPINEKAFVAALQKFGLLKNQASLAVAALPASDLSTKPPVLEEAEAAPLPVLDPALGVELAFGDRATWQSMLGLLFEQLPDAVLKLQAGKAASNTESIRQIAHSIAGASSYCGTPALHEEAKLLENLVKSGKIEEAMQTVEELVQQIERLLSLKKENRLPDESTQVF